MTDGPVRGLTDADGLAVIAYAALGPLGRAPSVPKYNWNFTNFWRRKWRVYNFTSDIRNRSSLALVKLFITRKHNIVQWPTMRNLSNEIYKLFGGIHPRISILGPRRSILSSSPTWDICVWKLNLCYYSTWDICVGKLHLARLKKWCRGDGPILPTYLKKKIYL